MPSGAKSYINLIIKSFLPVAVAVYAVSCATMVSPSGGPKDVTPPKMISSEPGNLSTNFAGNKLILNFNEYVTLKTPEKYLLISPPLSKTPDIKVKGHSVVIKLEDSLRSRTTYNFYFGEAIVDITESNPVNNFNFAFSTGDEIDSLSLSGNVTDAFTRKPVKDALVLLYTDFGDSVPRKQIPTYVSRTSAAGNFRLNSLASGKYRAVALVDKNSDYIYNLPNELIGFVNDSVQPYYLAADPNDSIAMVTELSKQKLISIDMFPEPDSLQHILKSVIAAKNKLSIAFRYPTKSPGFRVLNMPDSLPWANLEWNPTNDTLNAWLVNKPDTLKLEITDHGSIFDTVNISTTMKTVGKAKNTETTEKLRFSTSASARVLGYNQPFIVTFANPVMTYDVKALELITSTKTDTTKMNPVAEFTDSIHRHLRIKHNWNSTDKYDLYFPKGAFVDIYNDTCDSTHVVFQMKPVEEYGTFAITVSRQTYDHPVIIQLLSDKDAVVAQRIITNEKRIDFGILQPGKYGLKAIMDINGNGKWDTGEFIKKIQPERVLIHPKIFDVKSNWELEENWDL